jgi:hypothetical protein
MHWYCNLVILGMIGEDARGTSARPVALVMIRDSVASIEVNEAMPAIWHTQALSGMT